MNSQRFDWSHLSREISVALSQERKPRKLRQNILIIPRVELRQSAQKTERARIVLGRIA